MTKEQLIEWRSNPTTIEIFAAFAELKDALKESLSSGETLCTTADETALLTARIVGRIDGLSQLEAYEYEIEDEN